MKRTIKLAAVGALSVVTVATALVVAQRAGADGDSGGRNDVAVQNGDAAVARSGGGNVEARAGGAVARTGDGGTEARTGVAQEESSEQSPERRDDGERGEAVMEEVLIKIEGDEGVEFSGTCTVDGEKETLAGQVPREFTFELGGGGLECEISKEGAGALRVVLVSGDDRVVQRVSGDSTLKLAYSSNRSVSSSTTSTSGSSSSIRQSSSVSSSSSVTQSSSSSSDR